MAHDTMRIIDTISDATSKLSDRLETKAMNGELKAGQTAQTVEAVNEFIDVLLSNFAYTFSEDGHVGLTHSKALTDIKERFENWL